MKPLTTIVFSILALTYLGGCLLFGSVAQTLGSGTSCQGIILCLDFGTFFIGMWGWLFPIFGIAVLTATFVIDLKNNQLESRQKKILKRSAGVFVCLGVLSLLLIIFLGPVRVKIGTLYIGDFFSSVFFFCVFVIITALSYID